jgi:DNA-binding CsgD family transcriptional regulator
MNANLMQNHKPAHVPAGILSGTEAFWNDGQKWLIHKGQAMKFEEAPGELQRMIADFFLNDTESLHYLKAMGITSFREGFERWYKCKAGGIDSTADFTNGKFTPDDFNNQCEDLSCHHRGRFCGKATGLRFYEIATINALKAGFTIEQSSVLLCVSVPGLKSRIEKLREKFGASNSNALVARAVELGI